MDIVTAGPAGGAGAALVATFRHYRFHDRNRPDESSRAESGPAAPKPVRAIAAAHIGVRSRVRSQHLRHNDPAWSGFSATNAPPLEFSIGERETKARQLALVCL